MLRAFLIASAVFLAQAAWACGPNSNCQARGGTYRIALPPGPPQGAIVVFHGWSQTSNSVMRRTDLIRAAHAKGLAVVAPQGLYRTWTFPGSPVKRRDEAAFVEGIHYDLVHRFGIPRDRMLASGFSMGGSLVWHLACTQGHLFAGFAPIAGTFWEPMQMDCPSRSPNLFHVHGRADQIMPMDGVIVRVVHEKGNLRKGIYHWQEASGCADPNPRTVRGGLKLVCKRWSGCGGNGIVEMCLHEGGHQMDSAWILRAWSTLSQVKGWS